MGDMLQLQVKKEKKKKKPTDNTHTTAIQTLFIAHTQYIYNKNENTNSFVVYAEHIHRIHLKSNIVIFTHTIHTIHN